MADLNFTEKKLLEKLLEMESGYVLDFSNRTFQEFVFDSIGVDIYEEKYDYRSGSKANRLRRFWEVETNYNVGLLLENLLDYYNMHVKDPEQNKSLIEDWRKIIDRLKKDKPVENLDVIKPNSNDENFSKLAKTIKESINNNEPETALDRLHTFTIKYIRSLCKKHQIQFDNETPLHSLFGSYIKKLNKEHRIESSMSERILKSSISVFEAFNDVRNNKSFAHDNEILNYEESIFIFNGVSNVIRFVENIEKKGKSKESSDKPESNPYFEDLKF